MSKLNSKNLLALLDEIFSAIGHLARYGVRTIGRLSWPALLGLALMAAFILTILPLALVLFAFFLLLKVAVGCCVIGSRRQRHHPEQEPWEHKQ